ncbi:MAG: hypothetical protein O3A00_19690, partial [Planctomycetota bacterium]|nr:hypothetical protein [Planctomycetota bacterium]
MNPQYDAHGLKFQYPADWTLDEQDREEEVTISLTNGETSLWSVTLILSRVSPHDVIETALAAFRAEYGTIDEFVSQVELCDYPTVAIDIEFECLDLNNSAYLRAFRTGRYTVFVLYQATDDELEQ